jgi:hypothetical protein
MSHDNRRARLSAFEHLSQFIETSIHCVLIARNLYPHSGTMNKKRFGTCVRFYEASSIRQYVKRFVTNVRCALQNDRVNAIWLYIKNVEDDNNAERFVIEFPHDFARILLCERLQAIDPTELDIACVIAPLLADAYTTLERRLAMCPSPPDCPRDWELMLEIRPATAGAEVLDMPIGCSTVDDSEAMTLIDASRFARFPLKSTSSDEGSVVILTYFDSLE